MANFVEIDYYNYDDELRKKIINIEHIAMLSSPTLLGDDKYELMIWWGDNANTELYFKTQEEAQALYDLLRGKKGFFEEEKLPILEKINKTLTSINDLLILNNNPPISKKETYRKLYYFGKEIDLTETQKQTKVCKGCGAGPDKMIHDTKYKENKLISGFTCDECHTFEETPEINEITPKTEMVEFKYPANKSECSNFHVDIPTDAHTDAEMVEELRNHVLFYKQKLDKIRELFSMIPKSPKESLYWDKALYWDIDYFSLVQKIKSILEDK